MGTYDAQAAQPVTIASYSAIPGTQLAFGIGDIPTGGTGTVGRWWDAIFGDGTPVTPADVANAQAHPSATPSGSGLSEGLAIAVALILIALGLAAIVLS